MEQVAFKQVVSKGCGLDVHEKTVVATIGGEGVSACTREFSTFTRSLTGLRDWLIENRITHVAMESTGVYWKPVYNILEPTGMTVWIVNARHIKYVPGHKTDKKDSAWICKLLLAGLLKPSYIPPKEQRQLRDLTRYRRKLIQHAASEKNRIIRILEDCNVKLASVLSHANGAVGAKLINMLIDGRQISMADVEAVYHRKLKATKEELLEACNGFVTEHHSYLLQLIQRDVAATEGLIADITAKIKVVLSPYDGALEQLKRIPGIDTQSAEDLVAEIGLDMSVFPTDRHISSWAGIAPGNNESAGKKKADG